MSRRKPDDTDIWQWNFILYGDDADQLRVQEYLDKLANDGKASAFIREALIEKLDRLDAVAAAKASVKPASAERTFLMRSPSIGPTNPPISSPRLSDDADSDDEVTYEDID